MGLLAPVPAALPSVGAEPTPQPLGSHPAIGCALPPTALQSSALKGLFLPFVFLNVPQCYLLFPISRYTYI